MQNIPQNNSQGYLLNRRHGGMEIPKITTNAILKKISLSISILALLALVGSDWAVQTAMAASPDLDLKLSGPQQTTGRQMAQTKQPFTGIKVQLVNPGVDRPDARLRLFIHPAGEVDHHDVQTDDIKVAVQEGNSWVSVPLEPIDGGGMGAIGAEGTGHKDIHQRGGFAIPAKSNKTLQLRITFGSPGIYQVVVALSPDNGNTHLAKPSFITVEAQ